MARSEEYLREYRKQYFKRPEVIERLRELREINKDERNARRRERYRVDAEHREVCKRQSRKVSKQKRMEYRLRKEFGLTLEEYQCIGDRQKWKCAICGADKADARGHRLHVDHCHATGKVRGLLCGKCNTAIGRFKDSIEYLHRAVEYLRGSKESPNLQS
jgi:hypothetical protein